MVSLDQLRNYGFNMCLKTNDLF